MTAPRLLVVADYFLPGFRAGGPIRAIANTIARLSGDMSFAVVTRDHDTDGVPYPDIVAGDWNRGEACGVYYVPRFTCATLARCVRQSSADAIWLNSFCSRGSLRVLLLRRLGRLRQPVLLAPRGELARGALRMKPWRKRLGIAALRTLHCLDGVHWIAASPLEAEDIRAAIGPVAVTIVPESVGEVVTPSAWPVKEPNRLRVVFASRIDAMKNLKFLLEALARTTGLLHLDIVGPIDNPAYWDECRAVIAAMPANVTVEYVGVLAHQELGRRLQCYDLLALPSLGENFGHIVVESWAAGCPVLVSDRTPWRRLAADGVGWDVPLDREQWITALERCVALGAEEHGALRRRAVERARRVSRDGVRGDETLRELVRTVARRGGGGTAPLTTRPSEHGADPDPTPCR